MCFPPLPDENVINERREYFNETEGYHWKGSGGRLSYQGYVPFERGRLSVQKFNFQHPGVNCGS